jgi:RND family efflux transporter MFP subunit
VLYQKVSPTGGLRERIFSGAAKAGAESDLSFRVDGTLEELDVNVGDAIRRGQRIARIDATDYELRVEDTEASLAQARAQAVRAQADLERIRSLYERDNASQADYDAALAGADSSRANVRSMEKKLESARRQVEYCTLLSPVDGVVAEVPVEVNENVRQGQPVMRVTSGDLPEVQIAVPEILIGQIRQGQAVRVAFDALPGRTYRGIVTEVAPTAAEGLTTYPVTVRLNQPDPGILPGMAAEAVFQFGADDSRSRYVLPTHAVMQDRDGRFVYVVTPGGSGLGVVERRPVTVGELVTDGLEVFEGLQDGELVVTTGAARIQEGQEVKLSQDSSS